MRGPYRHQSTPHFGYARFRKDETSGIITPEYTTLFCRHGSHIIPAAIEIGDYTVESLSQGLDVTLDLQHVRELSEDGLSLVRRVMATVQQAKREFVVANIDGDEQRSVRNLLAVLGIPTMQLELVSEFSDLK